MHIEHNVQRTFCRDTGLACDLDVVQHVLTVLIQQHIHLALRLRRLNGWKYGRVCEQVLV